MSEEKQGKRSVHEPGPTDVVVLDTDERTGKSCSIVVHGDGTSEPLPGDVIIMPLEMYEKPIPIKPRPLPEG